MGELALEQAVGYYTAGATLVVASVSAGVSKSVLYRELLKREIPRHFPSVRGIPWEERFWKRVTRGPDCWEWRGLRGKYGVFATPTGRRCAHRISYELLVGPIPDGLQLDHLCRNPSCVNPEHLEPVTLRENLRRGLRTRLNPDLVREIRASTESAREVARRLGVSKACIADVRLRRTWKDIP